MPISFRPPSNCLRQSLEGLKNHRSYATNTNAVINGSKDSRVAIIGGGAWGLSTALHLNSAGYTDITVFERAPQQPSRYSAAWDLNKIVRAEYEDRFYTELALVGSMLIRIAPSFVLDHLCQA